MRVMFAGPSGLGKTTLAKELSDLKFISGSVSDLIPATKEMKHENMLARDPKELLMEDYQIIQFRHKLFRDEDNFVSDRSYLDSAAYFYYKQADKIPACEMEHFLELCKMLMNKDCTHLIMLNLTPELLRDWITEDNNKRITSNYFQVMISRIMKTVIQLWGFNWVKDIGSIGPMFKSIPLAYGATEYLIKSPYGETKVLVIDELNKEIRLKLIEQFLK